MVLPYHKSDYGRLAAEDEIMDFLRRTNVAPGEYVFPRPAERGDMKKPEFIAKMNKGPLGMLTLRPGGQIQMGKIFGLWFLYLVVVGVFAAYLAGHALGPGAPRMAVWRFTGTTAFAGYALALWQNTIWYWRSASITFKATVDGLIYAALTAAIFGWLWPA
jgi:hypothetical protein